MCVYFKFFLKIFTLIQFQYPFINNEPSYDFASFSDLLDLKNINHNEWTKLEGFEKIDFLNRSITNEITSKNTDSIDVLGKRGLVFMDTESQGIQNIDISIPKSQETILQTKLKLKKNDPSRLKDNSQYKKESRPITKLKTATSVEGTTLDWIQAFDDKKVDFQNPYSQFYRVTNTGQNILENLKINSPPVEEETPQVRFKIPFPVDHHQKQKDIYSKITSEMLEKYQKMDRVIYYFLQKVIFFLPLFL